MLKPNPLIFLTMVVEYEKNKDVVDMDFEANSSYSLMNCTHIAFEDPLFVAHEAGFPFIGMDNHSSLHAIL